MKATRLLLASSLACTIGAAGCAQHQPSTARAVREPAEEPLPSWNEGQAKQAILAFVQRVTTPASPDFLPPAERVAVFDNDGTLWSEQPLYFQFAFALDRVAALAPAHPEWGSEPAFAAALRHDLAALAALGERGIAELLAATHTGNTTDEFTATVRAWIQSARHPRFDRRYVELVYQPMLELMAHLRAHGFKNYIVSGGGVEFMRAWAEAVYGVPPEQIVGSRGKLQYGVRNGVPVLDRLPEVEFVDDGAGKPVGIQQQIGRRPVLAFGNSDGDFEMLEWATSAPGARLAVLIHHTDAKREWAYDRASKVGHLSRALDEASRRGWIRVDMQQDWRRIYPFED